MQLLPMHTTTTTIHCLKKNLHPFYCCDIFVRFCPILLIFGRNIPQEISNKTCTRALFISRFMFVLYLVKTSDASERTLRRRPLHVRLVIEPESHNFFKTLVKPFTFQPLSENSKINFFLPKTLNLHQFSIKMRTSAAAWLLRDLV